MAFLYSDLRMIVGVTITLIVFCTGAKTDQRKSVLRQGASALPTAHLRVEPSQEDYGDAACMRWSGGTCKLFPCHPERGHTSCVDNMCICAPGYCADARGICELAQTQQGKMLGTYAIRFQDALAPYMTATKDDFLLTADDSRAQWKLYRSPDGFVRFESALRPGSLLGMYPKGGADGSLVAEIELKTFNAKEPKPVRNLMLPAPTESSFLLYEIPGKGIEIYHPVQKASVASSSSRSDVTECYYWWWKIFSKCSGQEFVTFEPHLAPGIAVLGEKAAAGNVVSTLNWMQYALLFATALALGMIINLIFNKMGWNVA